MIPVKDETYNLYYLEIPSSYVSIPYEIGIVSVSYAVGRPFVRLESGTWRNYINTTAGKAMGTQPYFVENTRMYFPNMNQSEAMAIFMVLAVAYSTINPREQINIAPNVTDAVIDLVTKKFSPQPPVIQGNATA